MMKKKKVLAISGSTRKGSSNEMILRFIAEIYQDQLDVEIYYDIDKLPHFNPDLDHETPPAAVAQFRAKIQSADGVLFCTPEYVFSLPGSFKNALDWNVSTTIFTDKPVAMIVASASGEKAFESLYLILSTIQAKISENEKLLIKGSKGKVDNNGRITDEETVNKINLLVQAFIQSMEEQKLAAIA